jgi:hypothetical protein
MDIEAELRSAMTTRPTLSAWQQQFGVTQGVRCRERRGSPSLRSKIMAGDRKHALSRENTRSKP